MKTLSMLVLAFMIVISFVAGDAEATKRFGSGKTSGLQRQSSSVTQPSATPSQSTVAGPTAASKQSAATSTSAVQLEKRSWMGPLAGLAAGIGLAALASHFGLGDELASLLLIGLLGAAVMVAISFFLRRRDSGVAQKLQYAAAGRNFSTTSQVQQNSASTSISSPPVPWLMATSVANIPDDFDIEGFLRNAKANFLRLQAANDARNLDDIREFTSPEMFAEIQQAIAHRGAEQQQIDVIALDAAVADVAEEANRYVVSVRFSGQISENKAAVADSIDEIWHLTKPADGSGGWVVAGIQQAH